MSRGYYFIRGQMLVLITIDLNIAVRHLRLLLEWLTDSIILVKSLWEIEYWK
jgi:hypothetical protein